MLKVEFAAGTAAFVVAAVLLTTAGSTRAQVHTHAASGDDDRASSCVQGAAPSVHCGTTPTPAFDRSGRLWVVFAQAEHVYVSIAENGEAGFGTPVRVNDVPEALDVNGENRPKIAFGAGNEIYVSWTKKLGGGYNGDVRFSRSLDEGKSFEPPVTINDDGLRTGHRFESLHVDPVGNIYIVWLDKRDLVTAASAGDDYVGAAVYYTVSTDGGASFAANRRVAGHSCECCRIAVADYPAARDVDRPGSSSADGGANDPASPAPPESPATASRGTASSVAPTGVAIFWRHVFGEMTRDHAFAVLGLEDILIPAVRATHDDWQIDACPHHGPAMTQAGDGSYHLAWFTAGAERKGIYYGRYAPDTPSPRQLESVAPSAGAGHPTLASAANRLYLAWKEFDGESTKVNVTVSSDGGETWSTPTAVAHTDGASDHPFLLSHAGKAVLSWHTEVEGLRILPVSLPQGAVAQRGTP